jgi:hypothetical protein
VNHCIDTFPNRGGSLPHAVRFDKRLLPKLGKCTVDVSLTSV